MPGLFPWAVLGSNQAPPLGTPMDRSGHCGRIPLRYRRCDRSASDKCGHAGHSLRAVVWTKRGRNGATSRAFSAPIPSRDEPCRPPGRFGIAWSVIATAYTTGDDLGTVGHPVHVQEADPPVCGSAPCYRCSTGLAGTARGPRSRRSGDRDVAHVETPSRRWGQHRPPDRLDPRCTRRHRQR